MYLVEWVKHEADMMQTKTDFSQNLEFFTRPLAQKRRETDIREARIIYRRFRKLAIELRNDLIIS